MTGVCPHCGSLDRDVRPITSPPDDEYDLGPETYGPCVNAWHDGVPVTLGDIAAYFEIGDDPQDWAGQIRAIEANAAAELADAEAKLEAERAALSLAVKAIDAALAETRHLTAERDEAREWGEHQAHQRSLWYPKHERSWRVPRPPWAPPWTPEEEETEP